MFAWTALSAAASASDWRSLAVQLRAEEQPEREAAGRALRALPNLQAELKAALRGSDSDAQELALEAIGNLPLPEMAPELLKLPRRTVSGTLYHTINSLMTGAHKDAVAKAYLERLASRATGGIGAADAVHILHGLGAAGVAVPPRDLAALVNDPVPQVREAVVEYAASRITAKDLQYRSVVRTAQVSQLDSDRYAAYRAIASMPADARKAGFKDAHHECAKDEAEAVRALCREVAP